MTFSLFAQLVFEYEIFSGEGKNRSQKIHFIQGTSALDADHINFWLCQLG